MTKQYVQNNLQLIEYNGENLPLIFQYIATNSNRSGLVVQTQSGNITVNSNTIVWVSGVGPYMVQEGAWILVESLATLFQKSSKIYTTDNHGNYSITSLKNVNDQFNQIRFLENDNGYILVSDNAPYYFYNSDSNPLSEDNSSEKIIFDIYKCSVANGIRPVYDDKLPKFINLDGIFTGFCNDYRSATAKIYANAIRLDTNRDYYIKLSSDNKAVQISNNEILLSNLTNKEYNYYSDITFSGNIVNTVFNLTIELYIDQELIDYDNLAIHIICPKPPAPTPQPINPIKAEIKVVS